MLRHKLIHSLVLGLFFLIAGSASAQVYTVAGQIRDHQGNVIPAATVIVLSGNLTTVNTATQPGSPLATIYSDPAGTMVINQTSNPVTTNGLGQFVAYAAPGSYVIQAYRNGFQLVTPISITTNGTGCTISGPAGGIVFNNGSGGCAVTNVVVVGSSYACTSTGLNAAIAAVEANTNTSGIVDARSCQGTGTISATVTIGAVNKPVRLLIDSGTNWNCTITNNTDCWDVNPNSSFIATGETQTPGGVGGLTLANSASIAHEVALLNQGANAGFDIENLTLQPNSSATLSGAAFYMLNPLQVGTVRGVTVAGLPAILMEITETAMGGGAGPINIENVQLDCETVTGCKPFLEQGVSGAGVMAGINFYGGVLAHPPSGVHIMADLEGISGSGNQCSGVNFWGTQFESSNSTDDGIYINHCTGVRIDATIASAVTPGANFVYIADCAGTSIKCAGASTDGVTVTGLNNFDAWTNSINNTISGTVIPTSDTNRPSLYTYHTVGETLTHVFDDYEGIEATIDSNGIYTSSLSTPIFNVGPNASVTSYLRVINNVNDIFGPGANASYLIMQNNNAGATAGQGIIFAGDSLTSRFAIKAMTGSGNVTNLGCGGFFAGGQGSATVLDTQLTVCPTGVNVSVPFTAAVHVTLSGLLTSGTIANAICSDSGGNLISSSSANCFGGSGGGAFSGGLGTSYQDVGGIASPANPASGNARLYFNSGTSLLACLTSSGGNCLPGSGSGVSAWSGDGALYTNSSSTGAVTATLGTAGAHKWWGNNTGSTATPGYESIGYADLPALSANQVLGALTATTPSGLSVPSCSGATNALIWTSGTGFGCNTITGGSSAFNAITSGTNTTAAMVVGSGASLNFTGSGTINASTLLGNTWLIPGAIGGTTPNTGAFSTLSATGHVTFSGALTSGTITGSWCTDSGGDVINIAGTNCYTGLTNPMTTLGDTIYGGASGTPTRLAGPTAPNGVPQILTDIPSAGAAVAETWQLGGVPVNNNSETTCASQTLNVLDRGTAIFCSGTSTSTFTFPVHTTTGFGSNYPFLIVNNNSGTMTLTPTTDTIDNSSLFTQWADFLYNNSSGNWQTVQVPQFGAFPDCHTSGSSALLFTKSTGAFTCNTISGSGTVNAGAQYQLAMYPNSGTNAVVGPTSTSPKTDASGDLIVGSRLHSSLGRL